MRLRTPWSVPLLVLTIGWLGTWWSDAGAQWWRGTSIIPAGTVMNVRVEQKISTEHAVSGDTWSGTVTQSVVRDGRAVIPAGTPVTGVVMHAAQGTHNSRARLDLAVRQLTMDGRVYHVNAESQPIIAGSKNAKKIGAIVGGAAVGGLLGRAIGGGKGTVIGGVLGGAAGYGLTRNALRTLQIKSGTIVPFTMREEMVAAR